MKRKRTRPSYWADQERGFTGNPYICRYEQREHHDRSKKKQSITCVLMQSCYLHLESWTEPIYIRSHAWGRPIDWSLSAFLVPSPYLLVRCVSYLLTGWKQRISFIVGFLIYLGKQQFNHARMFIC